MPAKFDAMQVRSLPQRGFRPTLLATALLLSAVTANAYADGASAAANLYTNLARSQRALSVKLADLKIASTPVRGMYVLAGPDGKMVAITNESGTIYGDKNNFRVLQYGGHDERPMTAEEQKDLRAEIIANIDYSKLIKVVYGNGGGRKMMMFSALDCGFCQKLEATLEKHSAKLNTTFYVYPGTLQDINEGGLARVKDVMRIWCDPNNGTAWRNYWTKQIVPPERNCSITPEAVELGGDQVQTILAGAGARVLGYPSIVNEDGDNVSQDYKMNAATATAVYGPNGRPTGRQPKPAYWIVSQEEARVQLQALDAQYPVRQQQQQQSQQQRQQPGKINTKDLLKKLFN